MAVVLHQFRYSHYNDKARWALAWKRVAHERVSYRPGPHMRAIEALSGQRQTPVLVWDGEVIAGSDRIVDALESRVADAVSVTGQLVGDGFTAADLTAAALLAPLVNPAHPDMNRPRPMPPALEALAHRWQSHRGGRWVLDQYARHRPDA